MRIQRKKFPPGAVREMKQWSPSDDTLEYRYCFAWKDPASGWVTQYSTIAIEAAGMSDEDHLEMVAKPAIAALERAVHRKCGMDYAIKNQCPLFLYPHAKGRFI